MPRGPALEGKVANVEKKQKLAKCVISVKITSRDSDAYSDLVVYDNTMSESLPFSVEGGSPQEIDEKTRHVLQEYTARLLIRESARVVSPSGLSILAGDLEQARLEAGAPEASRDRAEF